MATRFRFIQRLRGSATMSIKHDKRDSFVHYCHTNEKSQSGVVLLSVTMRHFMHSSKKFDREIAGKETQTDVIGGRMRANVYCAYREPRYDAMMLYE